MAVIDPNRTHYPVIVIGGGQSGLSLSYHLQERDIAHLILEKDRVGHAWRDERWDSFCLVTPNWQCQLPGFPYPGSDPDGFMARDEIVAYVEAYRDRIDPPLLEGVAVTRLTQGEGGFELQTTRGGYTADQVILAVSGYHVATVPRLAEGLPPGIRQLHSRDYRNPDALPAGAVLVIGSGQSGCQIAEDLHLAGRRVHLSVGSAPKSPRLYRGRDAIAWLHDMGHYDLPVERHPLKEGVRRNPNHYLTGRGGGREIDLRRFASEGMRLHGRLQAIDGNHLAFAPDLARNLDAADKVAQGIKDGIDRHIAERGLSVPLDPPYVPVWRPDHEPVELDLEAAGITAVIWGTGFRSDWRWIDLPAFDVTGYPTHQRGVTKVPGLYVIGLPWLHSWGSGRFAGIARDARHIVEQVEERLVAPAMPGTPPAPVQAAYA